MYTAQILNNAKSWKDKTRINKEPNFTTELLNNACNWTLLKLSNMATYWISQTKTVDIRAGIVESLKERN
jgi:hypothetical protein